MEEILYSSNKFLGLLFGRIIKISFHDLNCWNAPQIITNLKFICSSKVLLQTCVQQKRIFLFILLFLPLLYISISFTPFFCFFLPWSPLSSAPDLNLFPVSRNSDCDISFHNNKVIESKPMNSEFFSDKN